MNNKTVREQWLAVSARTGWAVAMILGGWGWALPAAAALPLAEPSVGRYACVAGSKSWFQPDMASVFAIDVLPAGRFHVENLKGIAGEGNLELSPWPGNDPTFDALFDKGAAVQLRQDDRQSVMVGMYGERGGKRTWLLRLKAIGDAYVRCGDDPSRPNAGPQAGGNDVRSRAEGGRPDIPLAAAPTTGPGTRRLGAERRGVDFPAPPVRLPAGARLGGRFEPGRYACTAGSGPGKVQPLASTYEFHPMGEWRRPRGRIEDAGHYVAIPETGRFDAFEAPLVNNTDHPDEEYAVYFRSASGEPRLYARRLAGNAVRETHCVRTGDVQGPAPAEVRRSREQADDDARARRTAAAQERGRRNLQPPPPGATRWEGLYANESFRQSQRVDPGPYGGFSRLVIDTTSTWDILEFQPDGHVYLGLRPPQTPCDRPAVKENGQPLCTTYSVDGVRLRIGHDDRGPVSRVEGGRAIKLGAERYAAVPPLTPARLAGTYEASSCQGALCQKSTWVFGADGSFGAYGLNQAFGTGAGAAGLPMPQGWAQNRQVEGRYRIEGQGLQLTYSDGQSGAVAAFLYPPKDRTLRIGGREYLRKQDKR